MSLNINKHANKNAEFAMSHYASGRTSDSWLPDPAQTGAWPESWRQEFHPRARTHVCGQSVGPRPGEDTARMLLAASHANCPWTVRRPPVPTHWLVPLWG